MAAHLWGAEAFFRIQEYCCRGIYFPAGGASINLQVAYQVGIHYVATVDQFSLNLAYQSCAETFFCFRKPQARY